MPNVVHKPKEAEQATDDAAAVPKKQKDNPAAKRYHTILRDFMAYTHQAGFYNEGHAFSSTELALITPEQIIRYFKFKLYGDGDVDVSGQPLSGSHHTLDYYKKAISSFVPQRDKSWDTVTQQGNPTRARSVNDFVRQIRALEGVEGSSKKRKMKVNNETPSKQSASSTPTASSTAKKARVRVIDQPAAAIANNNPNAIMSDLFLQMHQQNTSVIDFLGTLGTSIDRFKSTMQVNNQKIMANIHRLNSSLQQVNASVPVPPAPMIRFPPAAAAAAVPPAAMPVVAATATKTPGVTRRLPTSVQPKPKLPSASASLPAQKEYWFYDHPDGKRRSVPPSWTFPSGTLLELYILWHIGDPANKIYPMKTFSAFDVSFCGKRSRTSLSEARCLVAALDKEVEKAGGSIGPKISEAQLVELFRVGVEGLDIPLETPTGRPRNIDSLKWRTLVERGRKSMD